MTRDPIAARMAAPKRPPRPILLMLPLLLLASGPLLAQNARTPPKGASMMDKGAQMMTADPAMKKMTHGQRVSVVEFVVGNMVYVLQHEMGHAQIAERNLPVLGGKDEDAADVFATLSMLQMGDVMSARVLEDAAMGWFLTARRDEKAGNMLTFYDAHGLDRQRAYQIVCLMVGSDPAKFKRLADTSKLPAERQNTCVADYKIATASWEQLLSPYRRKPDQPKVDFEIVYGDAKGKLDVYAKAAKSMQLLEQLADSASTTYTWRAPLKVELRSCGDVGARYDPFSRTIYLCYEMAADLAEVYTRFGSGMKPAKSTR
jgi:hypothetical protein